MKWKCEVEYRGKRYELVVRRNLLKGCAGCAFRENGFKCKVPVGFPTCAIEVVSQRNGSGLISFEQDFSRVWRLVEK